jgi:two-component system, LuxR family, sensor kinase FixL
VADASPLSGDRVAHNAAHFDASIANDKSGRAAALSYVTIIWSTVAACALLIAIMYCLVWVMDRKALAGLAFSFEALAMVGLAVVELGMMQASTPFEWGEWVRWLQIPLFLRIAALLAFIRFYFGTGRLWLMWVIIGARTIIATVGFATDPNFNYSRIDSIERISFLGEQVTIAGHAVASPNQWFATISVYLVLLFVADASLSLWRQGTHDARRKVIVIGGASFVSWALSATYTQLMVYGDLRLPALLSPPYLITLAAMTFEMSRDTLRASRLARDLKGSEARLEVAASAAGLGLWTWDTRSNQLWATQRARTMFGFELKGGDMVDVELVRRTIHPDDLERIRSVWRHAAQAGTEEEVQFRINPSGGAVRLITARGRSEADANGNITAVQGVLRDVSDQQRAREENEELRRELAHVGRVSVLGTLSSSLAHELSQPLGAIQWNAEAAELLLKRPNPDLDEIRQILTDIQRDDRRAAEVIDGLRKLLKRRQLEFAPVAVDGLVQDVVSLLKTDAINRNVRLDVAVDPALPPIRGDRVHLTQVLINLLMNGMDAVADLPVTLRKVTLRAELDESGGLEFIISDSGPGIPPEIMAKIFEPFFTTKATGMGMGLSVSRTIVDAHGGRLWAENGSGGGVVFRVILPTFIDIPTGRIIPFP